MKTATPERQLSGFIAKFTPEVAALIRAARKKMRERPSQENGCVPGESCTSEARTR